MDLTTLWQEHRTFILSFVAGLLVFFIGQAVVSGIYGIEEKRRKVERFDGTLRKSEAPTTSQLEEARTLNIELTENYEQTVTRVGFIPQDKYLLAPGEKPDIQYDRLFNEARDSLVEGAKTLNITVTPNLGMPELSPTRRSEIQHALTALDIVTRVVLVAIESEVRLIESINMVPEMGRRKKHLISEQKVRFRMQSTPGAMARFLQAFALLDNYLAIDVAELELADPDGASVRADFTVSAITIIKEESET